MEKQKNIQTEIEKTLNSLDAYTKKKAKPFLYTRIQAKLEKQAAASSFNWLFDTPLLKPAFASLIIVLNAFTVWQVSSINESDITETENYIENFYEEYAFNQSSETYFELYSDITMDE